MSRVRADNITNNAGTGAPTFPNGVIVSSGATFSGNASVAGTLTCENVTSVDSIGLVTARTGIQVLAGGINAVGIITATSFVGNGANLTGTTGKAIAMTIVFS